MYAIYITASDLVGLVQPMLWNYTPDLDVEITGSNSVVPITGYSHFVEL